MPQTGNFELGLLKSIGNWNIKKKIIRALEAGLMKWLRVFGGQELSGGYHMTRFIMTIKFNFYFG